MGSPVNLCDPPVISVVRPFFSTTEVTEVRSGKQTLSAKMYRDARSSRDPRTREGRLLSRGPAANSVEVEPGFLRGFNGNTQVLAEERRYFDPSFFHVKNHRAARRQFLRQ